MVLLLAVEVVPLPVMAAEGAASGSAGLESGVVRIPSVYLPFVLLAERGGELERAELVLALTAYGESRERGELEGFLARHPGSAWKVGLLGNLGMLALEEGRHGQALKDWRAAWDAGKAVGQVEVKRFVDQVVGELVKLETRLGHAEAAAALLEELEGRELSGSASEARAYAREGLWQMRNPTAGAFLCGPLALFQMLAPDGAEMASRRLELPVKTEGYSLAELQSLAQGQGRDVAALYRNPGGSIPAPSVIHWKTGHYAAIVEADAERYRIRDAALGKEYWVRRAALEEEESGYYLVAGDVAGEGEGEVASGGWRVVSAEEGGQVIGAGNTASADDTRTPSCESGCECVSGDAGSDSGAGGNFCPKRLRRWRARIQAWSAPSFMTCLGAPNWATRISPVGWTRWGWSRAKASKCSTGLATRIKIPAAASGSTISTRARNGGASGA